MSMIDKESRNELLAKAFNGFKKQDILSEEDLSSSEQSVIFYNKVEDLDYWAVRIELIEIEKLHKRVINFIKRKRKRYPYLKITHFVPLPKKMLQEVSSQI